MAALRGIGSLMSITIAEILSFEPRLEAGTDFEGRVSALMWLCRVWAISFGGEARRVPDRDVLLVVLKPGGDVKVDVEYRFVREKTEEGILSRCSGGVVGSL